MSFTNLGQNILFALGLGGEYEEAESWNSRLKKAAYTASEENGPNLRLEFYFEDVSKVTRRHTSVHNFPGINGAYVQEHGKAGAVYPMRCILWGKDCDKLGDGFEGLLGLPGIGRLEHPMYGEHDVIPVGDIVRRDDLKTAANQVVFEVTFFETTGIAYPDSQIDAASDVNAALSAFNDALAAQIAQQADLSTPLLAQGFLDSFQATLAGANAAMSVLADTTQSYEQEFDDTISLLESAYIGYNDTLTVAPEAVSGMASSSVSFIQLGAYSDSPPAEILEAYGNMTTALFAVPLAAADPSGLGPGNNAESANDFHINEVTAGAAVGAQAAASVNGTFLTRQDALGATAVLLSQMEDFGDWADDNYEALSTGGPTIGGVDFGQIRQELLNLISLTAGYLIALSFTLKQERLHITTRDRTPIDLCAELYPGLIDDNLDFFMNSNKLVGKEIVEIPKGREIKYYV